MAAKKHRPQSHPRNAWSVTPQSEEWKTAQRKCLAMLRRSFRDLPDHEDRAHDALVESSRTHEGRQGAAFSTLAVQICRNAAIADLRRRPAADSACEPIEAAAPRNAEPEEENEAERPKLPRGTLVAYRRALKRYFDFEVMMVESLMFGAARARVPRHLRLSLSVDRRNVPDDERQDGLLARALREEGLQPWPVRFAEDFDAKLLAFIDRLSGGKGSLPRVGRPRVDPYARQHDKSLPRDLREWWAEAKQRHAGLIASERDEEAAHAIVRAAMRLAGIDGGTLNLIERGTRADEAKRQKEKHERFMRVIADAEKAK